MPHEMQGRRGMLLLLGLLGLVAGAAADFGKYSPPDEYRDECAASYLGRFV